MTEPAPDKESQHLMAAEYLLEIEHLQMHFPIYGGIFRRQVGKVHAVDDVSLNIRPGETLGLVGESGCGKTTLGRCILKLVTPTAGDVRFNGRSILTMGAGPMQKIRRNLQMIFQDPFESLNSRHSIAEILEEPFVIHRIGKPAQRRQAIVELLERVGLPQSAKSCYPHEFSGGQRQRIGIARAIALNPKLIVCDEPVSALDVSIQSQVLNLLLKLQQDLRLSYLFIAHDLSVVKHVSDRIAVMYLGKVVELCAAERLYAHPAHPYTRALISAIPVADPSHRSQRQVLRGDVPSPIHPPSGCHFHTRCPHVIERCRIEEPRLRDAPDSAGGRHLAACHRAEEI